MSLVGGVARRRTVNRVRPDPLGTDKYGDPLETGGVRTPIPGCVVSPRTAGGTGTSRDLENAGRRGLIIGLTLYAPETVDLRPTDRVEVDGTLYEIEGEPGLWAGTRLGGFEVALKRVEG